MPSRAWCHVWTAPGCSRSRVRTAAEDVQSRGFCRTVGPAGQPCGFLRCHCATGSGRPVGRRAGRRPVTCDSCANSPLSVRAVDPQEDGGWYANCAAQRCIANAQSAEAPCLCSELRYTTSAASGALDPLKYGSNRILVFGLENVIVCHERTD